MSAKVLCLAAPFLLAGSLSGLAQDSTSAMVAVAAPVWLKPDPTRPPLTTLAPGTPLRVLARDGEWFRVSFRDLQLGERVGFMRSEDVKIATRPASPVPAAQPEPPRVATAPSSQADIRSRGISEIPIVEAIAVGLKQPGHAHGVRLGDSSRHWTAVLTPEGAVSRGNINFSVLVYTPLAWIRQLASAAAKENRPFTRDDVDEDAMAQVFRIIALVDAPNTDTAASMTSVPPVHVVLRDEFRRLVFQPVFKRSLSNDAVKATGAKVISQGLEVKFTMDAVSRLRGPLGERDFLITVTGSGGEEKSLRITKQHFDQLP